MKSPAHILRQFWLRACEGRRRARFARSLRHLHGPEVFDLPSDQVLVVAVVRNGSSYLDAFFDYYRSLGIQHFVFLDHGSTDDTIARIKAEPGTIIDQSTLPLDVYGDLMRHHLAVTYGRDRWCLCVDLDEVFDFEGRDEIGLSGMIRYLEEQGATAMVAQTLEMFPKEYLGETAGLSFAQCQQAYAYFDISAVEKYAYHSAETPLAPFLRQNRVLSDSVQVFFGGVHHKAFGEKRCLSKHPLVFCGAGVMPFVHPNLSLGVRCADITGVLKHYSFAGHGAEDARPVSLFSLEARRWNRVALLIRAGFLTGSKDYRAFIKKP